MTKIKTLPWDVQTLPISNENGVIKSHNSIVRTDNNEVLSVMKSSYNPLQNSEFIERVEKVIEITGFELDTYTDFKGGRKVLAHLKNNGSINRIGRHKIDDYMVLGNSHDGSTSFFVGTTTVLLRCENQFSEIAKMIKIKHTKNSDTRMQEFLNYVEYFTKKRNELYTLFNKFADINTNEAIQESMIKFVLGVKKDTSEDEISTRKKNQMDELRTNMLTEVADLGANLWALFNGVTRYTTHALNSKDNCFGNLFGVPATLNSKAMVFAESLV